MPTRRRCARLSAPLVLVAIACSSPSSGEVCELGSVVCNENVRYVCTIEGYHATDVCPGTCDVALGCVTCNPGAGFCDGEISHVCRPDGTGMQELACDPELGLSCNPLNGRCDGPCSPDSLGTSYIGCEYYPVVTPNGVDENFSFAVAVSNTSSAPAEIVIDWGALAEPRAFTVAPGAVRVEELPWELTLKLASCAGTADGCGPTDGRNQAVRRGAYRLRSNQPVTVYQFNPLRFELGEQGSHSNDASLLLPANAWGESFVGASWRGVAGWPGFLALVGAQEGTEVRITTPTPTYAEPGSGGFSTPAGSSRTTYLGQGDVLLLVTYGGDLTGSSITASRPIQVIGGHYCAEIPSGTPACDHLEASVLPVEALSDRYLITAPAVPSLPDGKIQQIRLVATAPNTTLSYDPPQPGAPSLLLDAGDFVDLETSDESFEVSASEKLLVVQYMLGQFAGGNSLVGDPSMIVTVPSDQFRTEYQFHAPLSYATNYVNIMAPVGATVVLDGTPITAFSPIGTSGFGVARVELGPGNDGDHEVTSTVPFGITVYGYGWFTSYWYPGGTNVNPIVF